MSSIAPAISAQNTRLPQSNADLHPGESPDDRHLINVMKPTCGPDDGSNAGPWTHAPALRIDDRDKRVLREAGL